MSENLNNYGLDALVEVKVFRGDSARDAYQKAYGEQAPPFDPAQPVKRWRVTDGGTQFRYYVPSGDASQPLRQLVLDMTAAQAATVNLPGAFEYPVRVVPASGAYIIDALGQKQYINAAGLATETEAKEYSRQLERAGWNPGPILTSEQSGPVQIQFEPNEERRYWHIKTEAGTFSVGLLAKDRSTRGVGSPGRWSKPGETASPIWFSEVNVATTFSVFPEVPLPMRTLRADERVEASPFGVRIYPNAGGSGDGSTREIFLISGKLDKVLGAMGLG